MIFSFLKCHILAKHSERFAMLVQLLITCMKEIGWFMVFFVMWTFCFSLSYQIMGMEIDEGDYTDVNIFIIYWI